MPVTFIGDVHGWSDRLDRLLARCEGFLVFMGDLIDRGPDAPGVIDRVHDLCDGGRAACLMGNHEYALLRAIGAPGLGIAADRAYAQTWLMNFGGHAVCDAYDVDTPDALPDALGGHLPWLERLPWVLDGEEDGRRWIAVHAGLGADEPTEAQVASLRRGWYAEQANIPAIFHKPRAVLTPLDLPPGTCVISGHTVIPAPMVTRQRILCDTSGGMPDRLLSGVIWPGGRVVTSA